MGDPDDRGVERNETCVRRNHHENPRVTCGHPLHRPRRSAIRSAGEASPLDGRSTPWRHHGAGERVVSAAHAALQEPPLPPRPTSTRTPTGEEAPLMKPFPRLLRDLPAFLPGPPRTGDPVILSPTTLASATAILTLSRPRPASTSGEVSNEAPFGRTARAAVLTGPDPCGPRPLRTEALADRRETPLLRHMSWSDGPDLRFGTSTRLDTPRHDGIGTGGGDPQPGLTWPIPPSSGDRTLARLSTASSRHR